MQIANQPYNRRFVRVILTLALACLVQSAGASAAQPGALVQLAGTDGCLDSIGPTAIGCGLSEHAAGAKKVVVSPDNRHAYAVVNLGSTQAIAGFSRRTNGALVRLPGSAGCLHSSLFLASGCDNSGRALSGLVDLVISSDGLYLYGVSNVNNSLVAFRRDPTSGRLKQLEGLQGCITDAYYPITGCATATGLVSARSIAISPSGENVYVAGAMHDSTGFGEGIAVFSRDTVDGTLRQLSGSDACVADTTYFAEPCSRANGVFRTNSLVVSADGQNLYSTAYGNNGIAVFRLAADGALRQLSLPAGCIQSSSVPGSSCQTVPPAYSVPRSIALSPSGRSLYLATTNSVLIFKRYADGSLAFGSDTNSCLVDATGPPIGSCQSVTALGSPSDLVLSPATADGQFLHVGSFDNSISSFRITTNGLEPLTGIERCVSATRSECVPARGVGMIIDLAASSDGALYSVAENGEQETMGNGVVAVFQREVSPPPPPQQTSPPVNPPPPTTTTTTPTTTTPPPPPPPTPTPTVTTHSVPTPPVATTTTVQKPNVSPTPSSCVRFTKAVSAVSRWQATAGGGRLRLEGPTGGVVLRSLPSARFLLKLRSLAGHKASIKRVQFTLDGQPVAVASRRPYQLSVRPDQLSTGQHHLKASVTPSSGSKQHTLKLRFVVADCRPAALTVAVSSKLRRARSDFSLRVDTGGVPLRAASFGLPSKRLQLAALRKLRGKVVGALILTDTQGKLRSLKLRLPKRLGGSVKLLASGSLKLVLKLSTKPKISLTGVPSGQVAATVRLLGKRSGIYRNPNSCAGQNYQAQAFSSSHEQIKLSSFFRLCTTKR